MPLPKKYVSQESAIATYDFVDIASGLGYQDFFCTNFSDSAGTTYELIDTNTNVQYSTSGTNSNPPDAANEFQKQLDLDFDTSAFNSPRKISGNAYLFGKISVTNTATGSTQAYFKFILYKWDGTTETALCSQITSKTLDSTGTASENYAFKLPLTDTLIKKGDKIRLNVEGWIKSVGAAPDTGDVCTFFHDPATPEGILKIPFRIDL